MLHLVEQKSYKKRHFWPDIHGGAPKLSRGYASTTNIYESHFFLVLKISKAPERTFLSFLLSKNVQFLLNEVKMVEEALKHKKTIRKEKNCFLSSKFFKKRSFHVSFCWLWSQDFCLFVFSLSLAKLKIQDRTSIPAAPRRMTPTRASVVIHVMNGGIPYVYNSLFVIQRIIYENLRKITVRNLRVPHAFLRRVVYVFGWCESLKR